MSYNSNINVLIVVNNTLLIHSFIRENLLKNSLFLS